jgi:hypothetical protein
MTTELSPFAWPPHGKVRAEAARGAGPAALPSCIVRHDRLTFADVTFLRVTPDLVVALPDQAVMPPDYRSRLQRVQALAALLGNTYEILAVAGTWTCFGAPKSVSGWDLLARFAGSVLLRQWDAGLAEVRAVVGWTSIEEHGVLFPAMAEAVCAVPPVRNPHTGADFRGFFAELSGLLAHVNGNQRRLDLPLAWESAAREAVL